MLVIRLNRTGKNKRAHFRVVAQEHTIAPGGKHVEILGSYDPQTKKAVLKADRIKYWISQGAQVSDSAFNLFIREKVVEGKKREKKIKKPVAETPAPAEVSETKTTEAPKEETKTEETRSTDSGKVKAEEKPAEKVNDSPVTAEKTE